jgi:hypothetical protein
VSVLAFTSAEAPAFSVGETNLQWQFLLHQALVLARRQRLLLLLLLFISRKLGNDAIAIQVLLELRKL